MKLRSVLAAVLTILLSNLTCIQAVSQPKNSVLLRNIKSLTLYKDRTTTHRRVSAIPQVRQDKLQITVALLTLAKLKCIGGSGKGHYEVDVMRCTNSGSSYDEDNVDWTCKASLPPEFKLGETEVICEGYSNPDDPYILIGSCGVEYRLVLTDLGEEKYGSTSWFSRNSKGSQQKTFSANEDSPSEKFFNLIFWCLFIGVALWICYNFLTSLFSPRAHGVRRAGPRAGNGGGGWGGDDGSDPPPPYDPRPPRQTYTKPRSSPMASSSRQSSEGWRPGFWTGAATGAAAAYAANQAGRNRETEQARGQEQSWFGWGGNANQQAVPSWYNAGEGSSRSSRPSNNGRSSDSSPSTSRYESTGFGSTRRR